MRRVVSDMDECDRAWIDSACDGELIHRTSAGGFATATCQHHLYELEQALFAIAQRYPEVNHADDCLCVGCTGE